MMKSRTSPRRQSYDYTSPGAYFITICTKDRNHFFGTMIDGEIVLSEIGKICEQEIVETNQRRNYVEIDEYVVMPNHVHILLFINIMPAVGTCGNTSKGIHNTSALETDECNYVNQGLLNILPESDALPCVPTTKPEQTLGSIIRNIKSRVQKYANEHDIIFGWQGRYHDHIIRNEKEYAPQEVPLGDNKIRYYIQTNPQNRESDTFNQ